MRNRNVLVRAAIAAAVLGPAAAVFAQMPGLPPNLEEMMRQRQQQRAADPERTRRPNGMAPQPAPPGVPVPHDAPVYESFRNLQKANSYTMKMTMVAPDPRMQQMMEQLGMGGMQTTVVKPDLRYTSMRFRLPDMASGTVDDWRIDGVVRNGRYARKFSTPSEAKIIARGDASIAQQLAMYDMQMSRSMLASAASGPVGLAGAGLSAISLAMSHAAAGIAAQQLRDYFRWRCDAAPEAKRYDEANPPPLTDLADLGEQAVAGVPAHVWSFYVRDGDVFRGPMKLAVARSTGMPLRMEMRDPASGGGMVMEYTDFDAAPPDLRPDCL